MVYLFGTLIAYQGTAKVSANPERSEFKLYLKKAESLRLLIRSDINTL